MTFWKKKNEEGVEIKNLTLETQSKSTQIKTSSDSPEKTTDLDERLAQRYGRARSALGVGTVIQGRLSFDTPVRIDGKLNGDVTSTKAVIVGQTGVMEAQIQVSALIVLGGVVKGDIRATERVEILQGGRVEGTVTAPSLYVEEGSILNGTCNMLTQGKSSTSGKDLKPTKEEIKKSEGTRESSSGEVSPPLH